MVVEALFDELRLNAFVEGKNLAVIPGGFESVDGNLAERAAALVGAAPDAIVVGPAARHCARAPAAARAREADLWASPEAPKTSHVSNGAAREKLEAGGHT